MWEESPKEAAESLQKMLRGKLKYLQPPLTDWAEEMMLKECGITVEDLTAILITNGRKLPLDVLKKLDDFVRRWAAGGITRDGLFVEDPRSAHIGGIQLDKPITADTAPAPLVPEPSGPTHLEKIVATVAVPQEGTCNLAAELPTGGRARDGRTPVHHVPRPKPQLRPPPSERDRLIALSRSLPRIKAPGIRDIATPAAIEPDQIISPSKSMQWHCRDCHENFPGPKSHPPREGCPICGSHNIFDCNATGLPKATKALPKPTPAPPIPQPQPKPTPPMPKQTDISIRQAGLAKRHEGLNIIGGRSHQAFRLLASIEDPATMHSFRHGKAALSERELDHIERAIEQWPNRHDKAESNGTRALKPDKVKRTGRPKKKPKAKRTQVTHVKYESVASDDPVTTESLENAIAAVKDAETSLILAKKALADLSRRYADAA